MNHIAANSQNSFVVDMSGNLYTWGSYEAGLLGQQKESDSNVPMKVVVRNGYEEYFVEKVNVGQYHAGVIANRIDSNKKDFNILLKELNFAKNYFGDLKHWFNETIRVFSPQEFICLMIRNSQNSTDIKDSDFETLFLDPFFSYLKLYKKNFFHMKECYKQFLGDPELFQRSSKTSFKVSDLDKLAESKNQKLKDLYDFAFKCYKHFFDFPDDFPFFAKLVFKFKTLINDQDILTLFEYANKSKKYEGSQDLKKFVQELMYRLTVTDASANSGYERLIEANVLVDCILGQQTGYHNLFTWGVHTEGRLGYKEIEEIGITTEKGSNDILMQKIPKLVSFRKNIKIQSVSCGFFHSLALTDDRLVYAWGTSKYGCLGKYLPDTQPTPIPIEYDIEMNHFCNIESVAAGMYLSVALDDKGNVYTWGLGNSGRLGHGDENSVEKPKIIKSLVDNDIKIKQIACGDLHCACITTAKELYSWGNGTYGKLGHCNYDHQYHPTKISFFSQSKVDQVVCGSNNTMAVTTDSKLYSWGRNAHGMLGVPMFQEQNIMVPSEVHYQKDSPNLIISEIALGSMHSLLLCTNGSLYSCGNSANGVLGIENIYDKIVFPKKIISETKFFETIQTEIMKESKIFKQYSSNFTLDIPLSKLPTAIIYLDCSYFNTAYITNTGELFMSGQKNLIPNNENSNDELINEAENEIKDKYVQKIIFFREKVNYISVSKYHVICVADGKAFSWGVNHFGMCGISGKANGETITKPTLIDSIKTNIKMSCVSDSHSMVLTRNGEIYAFGSNMYGKLGIGDLNKYFTIDAVPMESEPVLVKNVTVAQYIACSNHHSACIMKYNQNLKDSYSIYTWGSGFNGKLGHNGSNDAYEPRVVEELDIKINEEQNRKLYFIKVALGDDFSLGLDENGKFWGWGKKKYLPIGKVDLDGVEENPVMLYEKVLFKFITAKGNFGVAIQTNGELCSWGDVLIENSINKKEFSPVSSERMEFSSIGFNHYGSIDRSYQPYSWGSNLFCKCGYESMTDEKVDIIALPKRIEIFFEKFTMNDEIMKNDIGDKDNHEELTDNPDQLQSAQALSSVDKSKKEGRDKTQIKLLDESSEEKNFGLMIKDIKINQKLFEVTKAFFKTVQTLEESKTQKCLETEDAIILMTNKSDSRLNKNYSGNVPLILAHNFQHYEAFIELLHSHPCYLTKIYHVIPNPLNFLDICKIIYGKNKIVLRSQRVISEIVGLWNSIFSTFDLQSKKFECEDTVLYYLYELLFKISDENMQMVNELISLGLLHVISKTLEKHYIDLEKEAENFGLKYKGLPSSQKSEMLREAKDVLTNYLAEMFNQLNENTSNFYSYSNLWILSRFVRQCKKDMENKSPESQNQIEKALNRILNYFIFQPCQDILKIITDAQETNLPHEYFKLVKALPEALVKGSTKGLFSQLFNDYKSKKTTIETSVFKILCLPKSEIIKQMSALFTDLSKSKDPIKNRIEALYTTNFDFTLTTIKETVKLICENGNEEVTIPLTISNIIMLQSYFTKIMKELDPTDPLKIILKDMNDFSIDELDSTSTINNTVVNITFKPYSFYFRKDRETDMIKCKRCLLPISDIFFTKDQKKDCMEGSEWDCPCKKVNKFDQIKCDQCGTIKPREDTKAQPTFFKRYYILNNEELVLLLEEVLYILPSLYVHDDIVKEVNIELTRLRDSNQKAKEKSKITTLEKFKSKIVFEKEHSQELSSIEKDFINAIKNKIEENIAERAKHCLYLNTIQDIIIFIEKMGENAQMRYHNQENSIKLMKSNIEKGYINHFFAPFNRILPKLSNQTIKEKRNVSKLFLVRDLINRQIISEILYEKNEQPKLVQKSYLEFEKVDVGMIMRLSFKEKSRKYVICGTLKHDYKLNECLITNEHIRLIRRLARHNPVIEFNGISFNSFYLSALINSLLKD